MIVEILALSADVRADVGTTPRPGVLDRPPANPLIKPPLGAPPEPLPILTPRPAEANPGPRPEPSVAGRRGRLGPGPGERRRPLLPAGARPAQRTSARGCVQGPGNPIAYLGLCATGAASVAPSGAGAALPKALAAAPAAAPRATGRTPSVTRGAPSGVANGAPSGAFSGAPRSRRTLISEGDLGTRRYSA